MCESLTVQEWEALEHVTLHLAGCNAKILWYEEATRRMYVQPGFSKNVHFMELHAPENGFDIYTAVLFMRMPSMHDVPICDCLVTSQMEVIIS